MTIAALAVLFAVRYARETRPDESVRPTPSATPAESRQTPEPPSPAAAAAATPAPKPASPAPAKQDRDRGSVSEAFRARRSDVWVEGAGIVEATLPDDREGSRHQKFIVRIDRDLTVLVSHNIDLAPRVPLDRGDRVSFRGEYVWNQKGGLVHWTHHDPRGSRGGWIRVGDRVFE